MYRARVMGFNKNNMPNDDPQKKAKHRRELLRKAIKRNENKKKDSDKTTPVSANEIKKLRQQLSKYEKRVNSLQSQNKKSLQRGSILENIVYIELLRRGYKVQIGKLENKEIDFVATKVDDKQYIQVTYQLPENSMRETDNLLQIPDNYKKIVITDRYEDQEMIAGIPIINIRDWLLEK